MTTPRIRERTRGGVAVGGSGGGGRAGLGALAGEVLAVAGAVDGDVAIPFGGRLPLTPWRENVSLAYRALPPRRDNSS